MTKRDERMNGEQYVQLLERIRLGVATLADAISLAEELSYWTWAIDDDVCMAVTRWVRTQKYGSSDND